MSEQNILNPTAGSLYSPDWPIERPRPDRISRFQAKSGETFKRSTLAIGRTIPLTWKDRSLAVARYLEQWAAQYEHGWFSLYDAPRGRYYSGEFLDFKVVESGNQKHTISATFRELPGKAMYAYPTNWGVESVFLEERDDDGNALVKAQGAWGTLASAVYHGGKAYSSNIADDYCEWLYVGYGFRFWGPKHSTAFGIGALSVDGGAETNIDFYQAGAPVNSAVLFTKADLPFGQHRVKMRVTGTKNAAAVEYNVPVDAIEVMI